MDFNQALAELNLDLKNGRVGARVMVHGRSLYLRAVLPPKPGKENPSQVKVPLGVFATFAGLKVAQAKALELRSQLTMGSFDWADWGSQRKPRVEAETVGALLERLELEYFAQRVETPASRKTWEQEYFEPLIRLGAEERVTHDLLIEGIKRFSKPDTRGRRRLSFAAEKLAIAAGVEFDAKTWKGRYRPGLADPEAVPSDEVILEAISGIQNPSWRWLAGVMATYGLRNHEALLLDLDLLRRDPIARVLAGKTGPRRALPIQPGWWKDLDLGDPQPPACSGANHKALGERVSHAFKRYKLPFKPYDLRRAWTNRAAMAGIPDGIAAASQGHSVPVHCRIYQRLGERDFRAVLEDLEGGPSSGSQPECS
jgi:hypothetical protein